MTILAAKGHDTKLDRFDRTKETALKLLLHSGLCYGINEQSD